MAPYPAPAPRSPARRAGRPCARPQPVHRPSGRSVRLALCNEVLRDMTLPCQAAFAAAVGYDGLEIAPFTFGPEPHRLAAHAVSEARRAVEAEGLVVSGLHWLLVAPEGLSITEPEAEAATAEVIAGLIELCAGLGGRYLIHGSPAQRALAPGREAEGRTLALRHLERAAGRAEAAGVTYCIEPLSRDQTSHVNTLEEAAGIVAAVGSPALAAMLDCASAAPTEAEPIPDLLRRHVPSGLVQHVHLNDPNRRGPGEGNLAFAPILASLLEVGYDGWTGVEPFVYEPSGAACAARAAGYLRGLSEAGAAASSSVGRA